jgi:hypothetical protein
MKWAFWLIGALGGGVIAYGTTMRQIDPPTVVGEGPVDIADPKGGGPITLRTRTVRGGGFTTVQVELPGGTWIECAGVTTSDCREAVRKVTSEFWDAQRKK